MCLVPAQQAAKRQKEQDKESAADTEANNLIQTTGTGATIRAQPSQEFTKHIPPYLKKSHSKENSGRASQGLLNIKQDTVTPIIGRVGVPSYSRIL